LPEFGSLCAGPVPPLYAGVVITFPLRLIYFQRFISREITMSKKTNKTKKNKCSVGRPEISIDWVLVARCAEDQCTEEEIAHIVLGSRKKVRTLQIRCKKDQGCLLGEYLSTYQIGGRASLRRAMFMKAMGREGVPLLDERGIAMRDDKGRVQWKIIPVEPDTGSQIFLSKNILGYRDRQEISGDPEKPLKVEVDVKAKLLNAINKLSARSTENTVSQQSDSMGSGATSL
jgi:hypothetical protein